MSNTTVGKKSAIALTASGICFLVGAVLHPHAPQAHTMAQVAYTQTGQLLWWPAHVFFTISYLTFAVFIYGIVGLRGLPRATERVVAVVFPIACLCVAAMAIHLLLPLGRDSVANSHDGWLLWVKDVVESADAVWALCVAAAAWSLTGAGIIGNRLTAFAGVLGGVAFGIFSIFIPLTNVLIPMNTMHEIIHFVPAFAILISAWAISSGLMTFRYAQRASVSASPADRSRVQAQQMPA